VGPSPTRRRFSVFAIRPREHAELGLDLRDPVLIRLTATDPVRSFIRRRRGRPIALIAGWVVATSWSDTRGTEL